MKHTPNSSHLNPEFISDLKDVFAKHNWPGHPIGFTKPAALAAHELTAGCDPGPETCPDGSVLKTAWVRCPDGTAILRRFCS